jgi:hypothetical protein
MKHLFLFLIAAFVFNSQAAHAALTFNKQVPENIKAQVLQDLTFVEGLQGNATSSVYVSIFGKNTLSGTDLKSFFEKRISKVNMDGCGGGGGVAACVEPNVDMNTMFLTKNYVTFSVPQIFRLSIIFHESRHTEAAHDNWFHVNCPVPYRDESGHDIVGIISGLKMEGLPACDTVIAGAYGLQATFLKNIANVCTNCSEKTLMDAELFGNDTIRRISDLPARKKLKDDLEKK